MNDAAAVIEVLERVGVGGRFEPETGGGVGAIFAGDVVAGPYDGATGEALLPVVFVGRDGEDDGDEYPADEYDRIAAAVERLIRA